jgi:hypothetical protein
MDAVAFFCWLAGYYVVKTSICTMTISQLRGGFNYADYGINGFMRWDGTAPVGDALLR